MEDRKSLFILIIAAIIHLVSGIWCQIGTSGYALFPEETASFVLAAAASICIATISPAISHRISTSPKLCTAAVCLILLGANPASLQFSTMHIAGVILNFSLLSLFFFLSGGSKPMSLFIAMLSLEAAAVFYAPLIWMVPAYAVTILFSSENKIKAATGLILTLLLPAAVYAGILMLTNGSKTILPEFTTVWSGASTLPVRHLHFSTATLVRISTVAIIAISAVFDILFGRTPHTSKQRRALSWTIFLTAYLTALVAVFYEGPGQPVAPMISVLASILICEKFFCDCPAKGYKAIILCCALIFTAERLYFIL